MRPANRGRNAGDKVPFHHAPALSGVLDWGSLPARLPGARRWRDLRAPRATSLERRLAARGGFCDCEIFLNGWSLRPDLLVADEGDEPAGPSPRPACTG